MATLQQQRQAIAAGVSAGRAATGQAARQATGQSLIERRTGKAVAADINRLTNPQQVRQPLKPIAPVGALPASRGRGVYKAPATGGGGGIASPLTEIADSRSYYAEKTLFFTADGLFAIEIQPLQQLSMTDSEGASVILNFKAPPTNV